MDRLRNQPRLPRRQWHPRVPRLWNLSDPQWTMSATGIWSIQAAVAAQAEENHTLTYRRARGPPQWVPNSEAVKILGCNQPKVEVSSKKCWPRPPTEKTRRPSGNAGSGDFGSGKSHLLTHLEHQALSRGFEHGHSKETPLYDLGKVFKSAVDNGRMPQRPIDRRVGTALKPDSEEYTAFFRWANDTESSRLLPAYLSTSIRTPRVEQRDRVLLVGRQNQGFPNQGWAPSDRAETRHLLAHPRPPNCRGNGCVSS